MSPLLANIKNESPTNIDMGPSADIEDEASADIEMDRFEVSGSEV